MAALVVQEVGLDQPHCTRRQPVELELERDCSLMRPLLRRLRIPPMLNIDRTVLALRRVQQYRRQEERRKTRCT